ncbi:hypothetical protein GPECTOR_34g680 [Gonium pectorale]|uniref:Protein kinase domain-containing protein n=1 Tax=Gonium pectorale TaxID=33097 RepID=A0A150GCE0_GONPE|nr:hypothetical protein GPECTOR_34g680 [Gonium pectorale]|eukprot:KXZ47521.1 hypothetical protein GPECTOR_34g680 [Gonium pectorale]
MDPRVKDVNYKGPSCSCFAFLSRNARRQGHRPSSTGLSAAAPAAELDAPQALPGDRPVSGAALPMPLPTSMGAGVGPSAGVVAIGVNGIGASCPVESANSSFTIPASTIVELASAQLPTLHCVAAALTSDSRILGHAGSSLTAGQDILSSILSEGCGPMPPGGPSSFAQSGEISRSGLAAGVPSVLNLDTGHVSTTAVEALRNQLLFDQQQGMGGRPIEVENLEKVGQGSFGVVYRGVWQGAHVAIKYLLSSSDQQLAASATEALLSKLLAHPNVVQTFAFKVVELTCECGTASAAAVEDGEHAAALEGAGLLESFHSGDGFGVPYLGEEGVTRTSPASLLKYRGLLGEIRAKPHDVMTQIVMEYCDRGSLQRAIDKNLFRASSRWNARVALRALLRTAREVAQGMCHLHASQIVHGDLKPGNVLLKSSRADRRGFVAKVGDFGLSRLLHGADRSHLECEPDGTGTLAYMAPEVLNGSMCPAADVYSFGVLLWQLVTGERPFADVHPGRMWVGICSGTLRLEWPADVHPMVRKLGDACLSPDKRLRPTFTRIARGLGVIETVVRNEGAVAAAAAVQAAQISGRNSGSWYREMSGSGGARGGGLSGGNDSAAALAGPGRRRCHRAAVWRLA